MLGAAHTQSFVISARVFNNGVTNIFMSICETMTIKELKEKFAEEFNINLDEKEIRIIVCGVLMEDQQLCQEWSSITCPHIIVV